MNSSVEVIICTACKGFGDVSCDSRLQLDDVDTKTCSNCEGEGILMKQSIIYSVLAWKARTK